MGCPGRPAARGNRTTNDPDVRLDAATDMAPKRGTGKTRTAASALTTDEKPAPDTSSSEKRPTSERSDGPLIDSIAPFVRPKDARALAAQITTVSTALLNGVFSAAELDVLRLYAAMVRSTAQLMTAETSRARQSRELPDLSLAGQESDDDLASG